MPGANDAHIEQIERALTVLFRRGNQPRTHERLAGRAGVSLDRSLYAVLARLEDHEPTRLGDLATLIGVDVSTVSRQVQVLAAEGLLRRETDPNDARAVSLHLTRAGHRVLGRVRAARMEAVSELLAGWSDDDRAELGRLLRRFADELEGFPNEDPRAVAPLSTRRSVDG